VRTRQFRKGDRVLVPGEVHEAYGEEGLVHVKVVEGKAGWGGAAHVAVDPAVLVLKEPGPPQVGDEVIAAGDESMTWVIVAIDGDWAWLKTTSTYGSLGRQFLTMGIGNIAVVRAC